MAKHEQPTPRREGKVAGMPFDFRRPTVERIGQQVWNANDLRIFPPKTFGVGWGLNFYWLAHPAAYVRGRRES